MVPLGSFGGAHRVENADAIEATIDVLQESGELGDPLLQFSGQLEGIFQRLQPAWVKE